MFHSQTSGDDTDLPAAPTQSSTENDSVEVTNTDMADLGVTLNLHMSEYWPACSTLLIDITPSYLLTNHSDLDLVIMHSCGSQWNLAAGKTFCPPQLNVRQLIITCYILPECLSNFSWFICSLCVPTFTEQNEIFTTPVVRLYQKMKTLICLYCNMVWTTLTQFMILSKCFPIQFTLPMAQYWIHHTLKHKSRTSCRNIHKNWKMFL